MSKKIDEQMVPLSTVTKMIEEASVKTADRLMTVINADDNAGTKHLSAESERMMTEQGEPEEAREKLRKMLDELPVEAQDTWLRTYYSSREYAKGEPDLKVKAEEYAARTAWDSVKRKFTKDGEEWKQIGAAVTFDAASGKWVVTHSSLAHPVAVASKERAVNLFRVISAINAPEIRLEAGKFLVSHSDWKEPVLAASAEEAAEVATDKLVSDGVSQPDAASQVQELIDNARGASVSITACVDDMKKALAAMQKDPALAEHAAKMEALISEVETATSNKSPKQEAVMAATYVDKGATPKGDQLHSDHSSIAEPKVAGTTTVETPLDTLPKNSGKGSIQFKHAESASGFDKLVEQLARSKGLIKEAADAAAIDVDAAVLVWNSGLTVESDAKQNTKGGPSKDLVSGVGAPTDKIAQPKEGYPKVPGYVNTEGLALDTLPKSDLSQSIEFKHKDGGAKFDRLVDQLKKQKGLTTEMQKMCADLGVDVASASWKRGAKALKKKYTGKKGFDRSACVSGLTAAGIQNAEAFATWLSNVEE